MQLRGRVVYHDILGSAALGSFYLTNLSLIQTESGMARELQGKSILHHPVCLNRKYEMLRCTCVELSVSNTTVP